MKYRIALKRLKLCLVPMLQAEKPMRWAFDEVFR